MNRTTIYLVAAAALAVVALLFGMPQLRGSGGTPTRPTQPTPVMPVVPNVSDGSLTLSTRLSHPFVITGTNDVYVTIDVTGESVGKRERGPVNLALVIDRSGSMSGTKIENARNAAQQLVNQLNASDRLAIVHYGSDVQMFDGVQCTESNKRALLSYIEGIVDNGGTNIGDGLIEGKNQLLRAKHDFKTSRMILISDGQPTMGLTDPSQLTTLVQEIRNSGISVSSIGVGSDFNESLMEAIAEVGSGSYAYLQDAEQLSAIFQQDLHAAGTQVARDVQLKLTVPEGSELIGVLGRNINGNTVRLPDFTSEQHERVIAHYRVRGGSVDSVVSVSSVQLTYIDALKERAAASVAAVSATVTGSTAVVEEKVDRDAFVFAARARSADNMRKAAEAMSRGDRAQAQGFIQSNSGILGEAAAVAGEGAVEEDRQSQKVMFDSLNAADDEDKAKQWGKSSRKSALRSFGYSADSVR